MVKSTPCRLISGNVHYKQYEVIDIIHCDTDHTQCVRVCMCITIPLHVSQPLSQAVTVKCQQPGNVHSMN